MTNANDTQRSTGATGISDGTAAGPVPEANRPGSRPDVDQDKPFDKFAALADRAAGTDDAAPSSADEGRRMSGRGLLVGLVIALGVAWVIRRVLVQRRSTRTEHLVHTVRETVIDTVDHVKDTVDHVRDAVGHVKDRLPG